MSYNSKYKGSEVDAALDLAKTALQEHQDISGKQDVISDLATIRSGAEKGATALQSIPSEYVTETELTNKGYATTSAMNTALADKVDKVSGKGLSTNDFTTALKTKLEGLSNYDDTAINNAIDGLQDQLDTLVSGDADTAIESFNEIIAFLDGVQDTETLEGIIASIEQQIAGKQDTISDLATIRSGASKGATAVQPTDLATVATSGSYNDLSNKPTIPDALADLTADATHRTVTDTEKATWNAKSDFSGSYNDLSNKPTIPSVDSALSSASTNPVQNKVINSALSGKQATISDLSTIRSGAEKGATAVQPSDLADVATSGSYNDLSNKPTIPTVNNATLTIQKNGTNVGTFTSNASAAKTINIETQLAFTNKTASSWVSDSTYSDYPYRCDIACSGVTANDYAEVVFNVTEATSGEYAPLCETNTNIVSIWSATNTSITIPTIIITK